jgi:autotransporter translocation and assembly factor TamB
LDVSGTLAVGEGAAAEASNRILVTARNVDLQQLETLLLQNRGFTGKLNAEATITGSTSAPAVDGHVEVRGGGFKTYKYESLVADVDYTGKRLELDATLQQSPTESITAKGTVPMTLFQASKGEGHIAGSPDDQIDLQVKSTALNLGVVQGFTDYVTNVTGTLQADVRVTGSGHDPHLDGFVDIKGGAFGVPLGGVSYSGLDTRIELDPDKVRLQKFTILDEHEQPLHVSGELAVHERQVGAVNINISSDNFELIDNELGDVGIDSTLNITGELRRPRVTGEVKLEAARLEVDRLLEFFYDPYAVESLPEVVSAEQTVQGSGSAEQPRPPPRAARGRRSGGGGHRAGAGGCVRPGCARRAADHPREPGAPRQEAASGRADWRVAGRHEHHRRRRRARRKAAGRAGDAAGPRRDRPRHV